MAAIQQHAAGIEPAIQHRDTEAENGARVFQVDTEGAIRLRAGRGAVNAVRQTGEEALVNQRRGAARPGVEDSYGTARPAAANRRGNRGHGVGDVRWFSASAVEWQMMP